MKVCRRHEGIAREHPLAPRTVTNLEHGASIYGESLVPTCSQAAIYGESLVPTCSQAAIYGQSLVPTCSQAAIYGESLVLTCSQAAIYGESLVLTCSQAAIYGESLVLTCFCDFEHDTLGHLHLLAGQTEAECTAHSQDACQFIHGGGVLFARIMVSTC